MAKDFASTTDTEDGRVLTVTYTPGHRQREAGSDELLFPCIRISGRWLARHGFRVGDGVRIEMPSKGRLVLVAIKKTQRGAPGQHRKAGKHANKTSRPMRTRRGSATGTRG